LFTNGVILQRIQTILSAKTSNRAKMMNSPKFYSIKTVDISEVTHEDFVKRFKSVLPVRITGFVSQWPACKQWPVQIDEATNCYLSKTVDDEQSKDSVTMLVAKDGINFLKHELCHLEKMSFRSALENIFTSDRTTRKYCRTPVYKELLKDIVFPKNLVFGSDSDNSFKIENCGVWISMAGCITPLHYDLCHGFMTQIQGRKRVTMFYPDDYRQLYMRSSNQPNSQSSNVDVTKWLQNDPSERTKYPLIGQADWYQIDLNPGDMLYLPPYHWHHVESLEDSITTLIPWDPTHEEPVHPMAY
jgi:hypothetical protein